mmetsp:Transcript_12371/g.26885  ORF Transcript_12371/g.26885 Transcript_12371/m.26885 type:complete len:236 (-) Transcript_12371:431-1138(-)
MAGQHQDLASAIRSPETILLVETSRQDLASATRSPAAIRLVENSQQDLASATRSLAAIRLVETSRRPLPHPSLRAYLTRSSSPPHMTLARLLLLNLAQLRRDLPRLPRRSFLHRGHEVLCRARLLRHPLPVFDHTSPPAQYPACHCRPPSQPTELRTASCRKIRPRPRTSLKTHCAGCLASRPLQRSRHSSRTWPHHAAVACVHYQPPVSSRRLSWPCPNDPLASSARGARAHWH